MFIGHFALALGTKRSASRTSLGVLFAAAQWPDLLWPLLLLAGQEHVRVAPGDTAFTPLAFVHYPISHSLLAVGGWALLGFLALVYAANVTGDPPPSWQAVAYLTLAIWLLPLWAAWVDRHRSLALMHGSST